MDQQYFNYLVSLVPNPLYPERDYSNLLLYLSGKKFDKFIIDRDRNRASDGVYLRYLYNGDMADYPQEDCTFLELLVGAAIKAEDSLYDWNIGDRTSTWFWMMIYNLGLNEMDNTSFDSKVVDRAIERMMNREYDSNGENGALFVVKNPREDFRNLEIFLQMDEFICEVFGYQ